MIAFVARGDGGMVLQNLVSASSAIRYARAKCSDVCARFNGVSARARAPRGVFGTLGTTKSAAHDAREFAFDVQPHYRPQLISRRSTKLTCTGHLAHDRHVKESEMCVSTRVVSRASLAKYVSRGHASCSPQIRGLGISQRNKERARGLEGQ